MREEVLSDPAKSTEAASKEGSAGNKGCRRVFDEQARRRPGGDSGESLKKPNNFKKCSFRNRSSKPSNVPLKADRTEKGSGANAGMFKKRPRVW